MAVMGRARRRRPSSGSETHRHAPFPSSKRQRTANAPPGANRKTRGGETTEIGLPEAVSATDRNQPQTPRRPRNEGVRGSNPRVGFKKPRYDRVLTARSLIQERSRVVTWWHWQTPGKPSAAQTTTGSAPLEYLLGNNGQLSGVAALPPCRSIVANLGLDGQAIARPVG